MLNVTKRAKVRLKELLEAETDDESIGLRLGKTASGALGVFPDRKRPDDEVVKHRGAAVLLVRQEVADRMENTTIDYEEDGPGRGLVVRRA
jgi:Fe-S cluster assembly iron-binding protein IscA